MTHSLTALIVTTLSVTTLRCNNTQCTHCTECRCAKCQCARCHHAECRCTECRGAPQCAFVPSKWDLTWVCSYFICLYVLSRPSTNGSRSRVWRRPNRPIRVDFLESRRASISLSFVHHFTWLRLDFTRRCSSTWLKCRNIVKTFWKLYSTHKSKK